MADATASLMLMKNVKDLRQRLVYTEKTLKKITKLEAEVGGPRGKEEDNDDRQSTESGAPYMQSLSLDYQGRREILDDFADRESVRSGLSTLPDSYTGFLSRQFPSSTPNRPQSKRQLSEDYDSDNSTAGYSDMMTRDTRPPGGSDNSRKVMRQNQRLLAEVEKLAYELQAAKSKNRELSREMDSQKDIVPELEDRILGLQAETEAHDKALRSAEERFEDSQREIAKVHQKLSHCQQEVEDIQAELDQERKRRKTIESQRDDALQTFLDSQDTLEEYQKKMKEKIRKMEENEDYLRDSLAQSTAEREELLEKMSGQKALVEQQEEEIQRLQALDTVEMETKADMEQQNLDLRENLARITTRFNQLEMELSGLESVRRENLRLKTQLQGQEQQLNLCQDEVEESRTLLMQLEQLAVQLQHSQPHSANTTSNDSGLSSMNQISSPSRHGKSGASVSFSQVTSTARSGFESQSGAMTRSGGARAVLADLRLKLSMKDAEIHRLQTCLQSRERDNPASMIEGLRAELSAIMDKNQQGSLKSQELETVISRLEVDRAKIAAQLCEMKREVSDKDAQMLSLEARLNQRNSQIIEFQEDANKKCTEINNLERELRKKTSQMSSLEEQLDEKMREFSAHIARMKQLEEEVISREEETDELRHQVSAHQAEIRKLHTTSDKTQRLHQEQCRDYERQIDIFQSDLEKNGRRTAEFEREVDNLKEELSSKTVHSQQVEHTLLETREELSTRTQQSQDAFRQLEVKSTEGNSQIKQLESSLLLCKEEIRSYLTTLEEAKDRFDKEISRREHQVSRIEQELKETRTELDEKTLSNLEMEKTLVERQAMLQQSSNRITELEEAQSDLNRQTSSLEQQLLRGKAQSMTELEGVERKLHQACSDMETKSAEVAQLTQTVRELKQEKQHLSADLSSLEHQLQEEQADAEERAARVARLEKDNRDLRVQLEQKIEIVTDMEEQMSSKAEDAQDQMQLISDLEEQINKLKGSMKENKAEMCKLDDQLQRSKFEVKAKDDMLEDIRDALKKTQEELCMMRDENQELKEALDDRQSELNERVSQVTRLDQTIKETHTEMEQRMQKLDETLQKYQTEIQERTRQITHLDDSLQQSQAQLRERTLQHQQAEQLLQRHTIDLQAKTAKLEELEKVTERQQHRLDDQKEENVEITQELRLTREQLQQQHAEFMETRRELAQAHREQDRLARELEEAVIAAQSKEGHLSRLEEQLHSSQTRESKTEARLLSEVQSLKKEMEDLQQTHQEELESYQDRQQEKLSDYSDLETQLRAARHELEQRETEHRDETDKVHDDLECLQNELIARKEVIDTANETIVLKEAEIARLQARLSGFERAALSQMYTGKVQMQQPVADGHRVLPSSGLVMQPNNGHRHPDQTVPQKLIVLPEHAFMNNSVSQDISQGYRQVKHVHGASMMFDTLQYQNGTGQSNGTDSSAFQGMFIEAMIGQPVPSHNSMPTAVRTLNFDNISENDTGRSGAFQPIQKVTQSSKPVGKGDFPTLHDDPLTAVGMYEHPVTDGESDADTTGPDPEQCMLELHERLRSNEIRQQEIERQLQNIADDDTLQPDTNS